MNKTNVQDLIEALAGDCLGGAPDEKGRPRTAINAEGDKLLLVLLLRYDLEDYMAHFGP